MTEDNKEEMLLALPVMSNDLGIILAHTRQVIQAGDSGDSSTRTGRLQR